jgi:hypothetical protein
MQSDVVGSFLWKQKKLSRLFFGAKKHEWLRAKGYAMNWMN